MSGPFAWSPLTDSNRRPLPYHGSALPTELRGQKTCKSASRSERQPRLGTTRNLESWSIAAKCRGCRCLAATRTSHLWPAIRRIAEPTPPAVGDDSAGSTRLPTAPFPPGVSSRPCPQVPRCASRYGCRVRRGRHDPIGGAHEEAMLALLALGVSSFVLAAPAHAASKNVEHLTTLPEAKNATAINFLEYKRRGPDLDVMLVTGRFGLKSYSLEDPAAPQLLDELTAEELRLRGDPPVDFTPDSAPLSTFWQNEDMDVDQRAQARAALARPARVRRLDDARAGRARSQRRDQHRRRLRRRREGPGATAAAELPAAADRSYDHMHQRLRVAVDRRARRHTSASRRPGGRSGGRSSPPTSATRATRGRSRQAVDQFRRDGQTAYSHDVQVDDMGIAWVSGDGGTRGYWTEGRHFDPFDGSRARGDAARPDPVRRRRPAGSPSPATRPAGSSTTPSVRSARAPAGDPRYARGELLLATEEDFGPRGRGLQQARASSASRRSRAASTARPGARSSASRSA